MRIVIAVCQCYGELLKDDTNVYPDSKQTLIQRRFVVVTVSVGRQSNFDVESTFIIWSVHQNVITPKIKHRFNVEITLAYQPTQPTHLIEIITSDTG